MWIIYVDDCIVIIKKEELILILIICYLFNYIGDVLDRYIIEVKLIVSYLKWNYSFWKWEGDK